MYVALRKKCTYLEFLCCEFFRIQTKKTLNTDTFYAMFTTINIIWFTLIKVNFLVNLRLRKACQIERAYEHWGLQVWARYLKQTLVFMLNRALREFFQEFFTSIGKIFFWGEYVQWAMILWGFGILLIFPNFLRS